MGKIEERRKARFAELISYEKELWESGLDYIVGIDEVGRGPLAGPVVTAAVILPKDFDVIWVDDSKKLSEKRRIKVAQQIKEQAIAYAVGKVGPQMIDSINIRQATIMAMKGALNLIEENLKRKRDAEVDLVLIDAMHLDGIKEEQRSIVKGDATSASIAAASILAKVARDDYMIEQAEIYPQYAWEKNKGYGTKEHIEALKTYGPTPIHRSSFLKKVL